MIRHIAALFLLALATSGCWDRVEVSDLAIVTAVALDKAGEHSVNVAASLAVPSRISPPGAMGGGDGAVPLNNVASQGRTIVEAISRMQEKVPRRLFWAHNAVIIVGEDLARSGVREVLEFFPRHRQPRLRTVILVTPGWASHVLASIAPIESLTSDALQEISTFRTGVVTDLKDFLAALANEGEEPLTARVLVVHPGVPQPGAPEMEAGTGPPSVPNPPQPVINGAAVFKDSRLLGFLDDEETRGVLWIRNELDHATVTVTLGQSGRYVAFESVRADTKLTPRFESGRLVMEIAIEIEGDLAENPAGVDLTDPRVIHLLEQEVAKTIAQRIRLSIETLQQRFGSDVLGFGAAVRRRDPQQWERLKGHWDRIFPEVEPEVKIAAFIRRTGMSANSMGSPSGEVIRFDELRRLLEEA